MGERHKVLVIDDEESIRGFLRELLEGEGCGVLTAASADEALLFMGTQSFDVILTDVRMPGLSGLELLRQVREFKLRSRVIIMTSYATAENVIEAMRNGAYDFLKKPIEDLDYVTALVKRAAAERERAFHAAASSEDGGRRNRRDAKQDKGDKDKIIREIQGFFNSIMTIFDGDRREGIEQEIVDVASAIMGGRPAFLFQDRPGIRELAARAGAGMDPDELDRLRISLSGSAGSLRWYAERLYLSDLKKLLEGRWGSIIFETALMNGPENYGILAICSGSKASLPKFDSGFMEQYSRLATLALEMALFRESQALPEGGTGELIRDHLTSLYKRSFFIEFLRQEIARSRRYHRSFAVGQIVLGSTPEETDEKILKEVGEVVRGCTRSSDVLSRSLNSFLFVLPETAGDRKDKVVISLQYMLEKYFQDKGLDLPAMIAVQEYPRDGDSEEALMKRLGGLIERLSKGAGEVEEGKQQVKVDNNERKSRPSVILWNSKAA